MSIKILIVDDSKLARMGIAKVLNNLHPDWVQIEAKNADEALSLIKQSSADIALLDFNMPGRDGITLAGELKEASPKMPMAIISANYQEEIIKRATDVGAVFLPKPLTENALSTFLAQAVRDLNGLAT